VKVSVSNVGWDTGYLTVRKKRCVQCFGRENVFRNGHMEYRGCNLCECYRIVSVFWRWDADGIVLVFMLRSHYFIWHLPVATSCRLVCSVNMAHSADCQHARLGIHSHIKLHFTYVFKYVGPLKISGCQSNKTLSNPVQGLWNVCRSLFIHRYS